MCNLYQMTPKGAAERTIAEAGFLLTGDDWTPVTVGPFGAGAFLVPGAADELRAMVGQWGMIRPGQPARQLEKRYQTNNARIESVAEKPTYRHAWARGQRCLIPAEWYAEPNWETGKNIWWNLKRADGAPWFLAGLWSEWIDPATGEVVPSYTMLTCNCDDHPMLARLHKPDSKLPADQQDKRSLIHIDAGNWEQWLRGSTEEALRLVQPQPVEVFDQADAIKTDRLLAESVSGQSALF
jgi:putative SOS response-associated peptidase YedK